MGGGKDTRSKVPVYHCVAEGRGKISYDNNPRLFPLLAEELRGAHGPARLPFTAITVKNAPGPPTNNFAYIRVQRGALFSVNFPPRTNIRIGLMGFFVSFEYTRVDVYFLRPLSR